MSDATEDETVPVSQKAVKHPEEKAGHPTTDQDTSTRKFLRRRATRVAAEEPGSDVVLGSLASRYLPRQHAGYVTRLTEAVGDPRNRNIALTGRYGSGKSSVLDEFEARHKDTTVRLAISTLAPVEGESGPTTTNRIQKELVKQIVYSAPKKVGRNSRFSRIAVPSRAKLFFEAAVVVAVLGLGLFAFGRLPELKGIPAKWPGIVRPLAWVVIGGVIAAAITAVRAATHGRFRIGDVKAGGTSVSLTEKAPSYFDQFIDELVHYFDEESKDIVIFEDLDRFEDPQIFQELRELNVLLNETPRRRRKRDGTRFTRWLVRRLEKRRPGLPDRLRRRWSRKRSALWLGTGEPLRFVYAVKDSLFEHLGEDSKKAADAGDAAAAETIRANRTKFFDVVIPLVPFISHRNARELLDELLAEAGVTGIDRRLVGVVARHGTDMRLLRNICNEYVVFSERLLVGDQIAPDLDPSKLFALVAYKNFHLTDFELITPRASALDRLLHHKNDLVRTNIETLEGRQRVLLSNPEKVRASKTFTPRLGRAVRMHAESLVAATGYSSTGLRFEVGTDKFATDDLSSDAFWHAVDAVGQYAVIAPQVRNTPLGVVDRAHIEALFPEGLQVSEWGRMDEEARVSELKRIKAAVETLRGAGFRDFVSLSQYTLTLTPSEVRDKRAEAVEPGKTGDVEGKDEKSEKFTFARLVDTVLSSDLARDLVRGGFLDQNFSLYAAQFYGRFVGVDVATFVVQAVQPNEMLLDYHFVTAGAVKNLLDEVDADFLTTVAAYNVDVVDHLITTHHAGIKDVVARLVTNDDDDRTKFLATYFTSGGQKEALAGALAKHPWHDTFDYLVNSTNLPDDVRPSVVGAALAAADVRFDYALPAEVKSYIEQYYVDMSAFMEDRSPRVSTAVTTMVARAGAIIPVLSAVEAPRVRRNLVKDNLYKLTADNLRTALNSREGSAVGLDAVAADDSVYDYCLKNPALYLSAIAADDSTAASIESTAMLDQVLRRIANEDESELVETWSTDDLRQLLDSASPDSSLVRVADTPQFLWPELARRSLFEPTLTNVDAYREAFGVDEHLAHLLTEAGLLIHDDGALSSAEVEARTETAVAILNSPEGTLAAPVRVELVESMGLPEPLAVESINAEENDLFKHLLVAGLVADEPASFAHFKSAGWPSIGPALKASDEVATFLTPDLVTGMVPNLIRDRAAADKVAAKLLDSIEAFLPEGNDENLPKTLADLASLADRHDARLSPSFVARLARSSAVDADAVLRLLARAAPEADEAFIVNVFSLLGTPYSKMATPGEKFQIHEKHESLLVRMRKAEVVKAGRARGKDYFNVTVLRAP